MVFYKIGRVMGLEPIFFTFFTIIKVGHVEMLCFYEYSNTVVNVFSISGFAFGLMSFHHCFLSILLIAFKVVGFQLCIEFLAVKSLSRVFKNPLPVHFYLYFFISAFFSTLFYLQNLNIDRVVGCFPYGCFFPWLFSHLDYFVLASQLWEKYCR